MKKNRRMLSSTGREAKLCVFITGFLNVQGSVLVVLIVLHCCK